MKDLWNKKLALRAFYTFVSLGAVIILYFAISHIPTAFSFLWSLLGTIFPFIFAFIIAYLINPFYNLWRFKIYGKTLNKSGNRPRITKVLSIVTSYVIVFGVIVFLLYIVVPQLISSVTELVTNIPTYYKGFVAWAESLGIGLSNSLINEVFSKVGDWALNFVKSINPADLLVIKDITMSIASGLLTFFVGFVASIYMLYNKERILGKAMKLGFSIFSRRFMLKINRFFGESHITFGKYLTGVITDAFIVGCLTFTVCMILKVPYALLISVIVGMTNVIPYFGPLIGDIPSTLIVLVIDPLKAVWLVIALICVQQIDANLITPRVVGQKTGMPALGVMFSIVLCGGLFGIPGMVIAVPLCSVVFSMIKGAVERKLRKKKLPVETSEYIGVPINDMVRVRVRSGKIRRKRQENIDIVLDDDEIVFDKTDDIK